MIIFASISIVFDRLYRSVIIFFIVMTDNVATGCPMCTVDVFLNTLYNNSIFAANK